MYREKDDVERARQRVEEIEEEIERLEEQLEEEIEAIAETYDPQNYEIEPFFIKPRKSDIHDIETGLLWESEQTS